MDPSGMVSVIVPVFNTEKYLEKCLDSLLAQTWKNIEILIVDDGSTDGSPAILSRYQKADPRIRLFTQKNGGLSAARNTALRHASGEWLMFADSDDFVSEDFCETALNAAAAQNADMVLFDATGIVEENGASFPHGSVLPEGAYSPREILTALASFSFPPNVWSKLCRRKLYDGIFFPEGENWEDCAILHRVIGNASRIAVIHNVLYYYLARPGSITKDAQKDYSIYKWRFLQYGKRYAWLLDYDPDIAALMAAEYEAAAIKYCAACAVSPAMRDRFPGMRSCYLKGLSPEGTPIPHTAQPRSIRLGRLLLRFCPPLFRTAAGRMLRGKQMM